MPSQSPKIVIVIDSQSQGAVKGLNSTQNAIQGVQKTASKAAGAASQFGGALSLLVTPITTLGVGLRQMGQALQGVSFLATAFVSIPIAAAMKEAATASITFDAALVAAQKTTGLLDSEVGRLSGTAGTLSGELRKMAQNVATPIELLGKLAEQAGQLGVRGVSDLTKFVRVAEIMGQTTDIAATDAIETFGRLAKALGVSTDDAASFIMQLANTVNMLENTTTASASDIADGMRNAISAASGFKIAAADLAGFIATMYDFGVGALESGTMFSRMASYVTTKTADLADLTGKSVAEIRAAFDKDFVGGLLGVIQAIGDVESASEQMAIASDLFGVRASRGVILLANQFKDGLIPNIAAARAEFESGTSIIDEYVDAMSSTEAQIGVLMNNLKVLGITLGDTFLPIVNTLLQYVVPAIQMITEAFVNLEQGTKLGILAGAAFLAILGPLTMILGTLLFSVGILVTGILNLATAFGTLTSFIVPVIALIVAVGAALVGLSFVAEDAMKKVRDIFLSYAQAAQSWGNNLVSNFATGMLNGIAAVISAAISIANAIAQFLASFSPPKKGPLAEILNWGKNLIDTYIQGFGKADFSAVSDVTGLIGRYLRNLGKLGIVDEKDVIPGIIKIRHAFTELIDTFKKTGQISQKILDDISGSMGEMGDKIAKYLELQLKVNAAQKAYDVEIAKLEEIRALREGINKTYDDQVKAIQKSGKPLLQQLSAIVDARYARDDSLSNLDKEESDQEKVVDSAEAALDSLKDQAAEHEGLLGYYLDELDLLAEQKALMDGLAKKTKAAAGSANEFAGALSGIDFGAGGLGGFTETIRDWEELIDGIDLSVAKFKNGGNAIKAFFAGLRGEYLSDNPEIAISSEVVGAIELGRNIRETFLEIKSQFDQFVADIGTGMGTLGQSIVDADIGGKVTKAFEPITKNIGLILGAGVALAIFTKLVLTFGVSLDGLVAAEGIFVAIKTALAGFGGSLVFASGEIGAFLSLAAPFIGVFALIALVIGAVVASIITNFTWFKDTISTAFKAAASAAEGAGLMDALQGLGQAFADLWSVVSPILAGLAMLVVGVMTVILKAITGALGSAIPGLITIITGVVNVIAGVVGFFANVLKALWALITGDIDGFKQYATAAIGGFWTTILGLFQIVSGAIMSALGAVFGFAVSLVSGIVSVITGGADTTASLTIAAFARMANGVNEWMGNAKTWVVEKAQALWTVLGGVLKAIGIDWSTLADDTESSTGKIGNSMGGVRSEVGTAASGVATSIGNMGTDIASLETIIGGASSGIGGSLGDIGTNASGLESIFGGAMSDILSTLGTLQTDTDTAATAVTQNLNGVGSAWGTYSKDGETAAEDIGESVLTLQDILDTFGVNAATTLTETGTSWDTLDGEISATQLNVSGYMDTLGVDVGILATDTETDSVSMAASWADLDAAVLLAKNNITGPGGYYEILATATGVLETVVTDAFETMELGVLDFEKTVDRVLGEIKNLVNQILGQFWRLEDEIVEHSIIPDMNKAIEESFAGMIKQTLGAVGSWSDAIVMETGSMSGLVTANTSMVAYAPDVAAAAPSGPLVNIDKMIVPNQQVGTALMDQLSDQIAVKAGWRRRSG